MKKVTLLLSIILMMIFSSYKQEKPLYKDAKQPIEKRIDDLLARMNLKEKVMQLNQFTLGRNDNANNMADPVADIPGEIGSLIYFGSNADLRNKVQKKAMEQTRLGIPILFGYDVIHGFRTIYPISLGQACSWNAALVEKACGVAAQEARMSGVDWTFSPMIDVARDGRWGRVAEGYGEDTYTNAVFTVASVKGYQGEDLSSERNVAACLKHYIGYGASEAGRDYVYSEISSQTLWDTYMLPYENGVKAGVATLMSSFNDISGTPGSANHYTLTEVLKKRWKHDGFVVSDWGSIEQLRPQGIAGSKKEAAFKAFTAGVEMDMMNRCYDAHLEELVKEGKVSEDLLNDAVRRVLRVKFRLGLFDRPYTPATTEKERFYRPESLKIAEQLAEESIVLLKNENKVLPINNVSKIAVIGPMAKTKWHLLGSWAAQGNSEDIITIYDALQAEYKGKAEVAYALGCDFDGKDRKDLEEAKALAAKSDLIVLCLGEKKNWSGENASRSTIALPQIQEELAMELKKLGKRVVLVLSNGRPLELSRLEPISDAILTMWQPGTPGGKPLAGVLSGRVNPSGKLAMTFPYSTGQIPIYYNYRQSARPHQGKYQDIQSTPLYEFAHGLSYTTFGYGELKVSVSKLKRGDKLTVEIPVTNMGDRDGVETVHWFIQDPVCTISRPVKELKYFEKQLLKKGETKLYKFEVNLERDLSFVNGEGQRFLESGEYNIMVKNKKIKIEIVD
ncbi:glycoside hydrolase family 3 C-terminal domain-containing protein [Pedobacter sp. MC2016-14]|uniref:glycoside hydrolase family 3 N-terminal domain-containing protein n=1 Tax=Pedobacter sp. MC2016-14 TaxID=2897327 RepID=UPI001E583E3B|nr:glycoside hydrolase family 3 N-terminal domain-containing protein [Pedobacter sp. MC2016-14]MCD0489563.1 glycoside hydrolase family 3 C-terminal domain-containing protein [Pedobacter sp. MC2016-14]